MFEVNHSEESAIGRALDISIIIACYNGEATLRETLESLVVQEWTKPWEIVFVDNGSTDDSAAIFEDYALRYPWVATRRIDASDKKGKVHALNTGIRGAYGRSLLFCDADDTVAPGWLAAMGDALETQPFVASRMDIRALNPEWVVRQRNQKQETGLGVLPHEPFCSLAGGATLGFHREVFEATNGFDPAFRFLEDDDFCVRAALAGFSMKYVPEAVYNYRYRSELKEIYKQGYNYSYYRGLLRRRYAKESVFRLRPWLNVLSRIGTLQLRRFAGRILRRQRSLSDEARLVRELGIVVGHLHGSIAFGVAPPTPPTRPQKAARGRTVRRLSRRAMHWALRPFAGSIISARTKENLIALTFDDGPDPSTTPAVLDALAKNGMKATFFLVGERADKHPALVSRIVSEGHEIGNHSWDHPLLPSLTFREVSEQIRRTQEALAPHGQTFMRPPYGAQNFATYLAARRYGYRVVIWSVVGRDWLNDTADAITDRIVTEARKGAIVLLHDTLYSFAAEGHRDRAPTIGALALLPKALPDYRFVTLTDLLTTGRPISSFWVRSPKRAFVERLTTAPPETVD